MIIVSNTITCRKRINKTKKNIAEDEKENSAELLYFPGKITVRIEAFSRDTTLKSQKRCEFNEGTKSGEYNL